MNGRTLLRAGLAYTLIALVGMSVTAPPTAAQGTDRETITVTIFKGAWYARAPACMSPIDCTLLPAANPYPEDTLHVALSAGEETARTYISLSFILPADAELTGGTLELPVDTDPLHGSVAPETAKMIACLSTKRFKEVRGSLDEPPATKCKVRQGATYNAERGLFTVDLDRFVDEWTGGIAALGLRPSDAALEGTDSWHVVFPAAKQERPDQPAIEATLVYTVADQTDDDFDFGGGGGDDPQPLDTGGSSTSSIPGPSFDPFAAPPATQPTTGATPAPSPSAVAATEPVPTAMVPISGFAGEGFAYPIVWALPLVLLVLYGAIGRALTKEL